MKKPKRLSLLGLTLTAVIFVQPLAFPESTRLEPVLTQPIDFAHRMGYSFGGRDTTGLKQCGNCLVFVADSGEEFRLGAGTLDSAASWAKAQWLQQKIKNQ